MIVGFGKTETDFEASEFKALHDYFVDWQNRRDVGYFDNDAEKAVRYFLKDRADQLNALRDKYKDAQNFPSRYSTYTATVLSDASNICVIYKFSHINRRALSPDGY